MKYYLTLLTFAAILFTGCMDTSNSPDCVPVDQTSYLTEYAQMEGYTVTDSGLIYKVVEMGDGEIPPVNQYVFITFQGKLVTGERFANVNELSFFPLNNGLLPGIFEGVSLMKEGSTYEFVMPTELAYNNDPPPNSPIQCGAVLIYEITLDSFLRDVDTFLEENAALEDIEVTNSGLQYRVIEEGEGENAGAVNNVRVFYEGKLTNGYVFDPGPDNTPEEFSVSGVISGFSEGLQLMNEGSIYQFFIPPNLAYGNNPPRDANGRLVMPPNAILVFEVEMVEIL